MPLTIENHKEIGERIAHNATAYKAAERRAQEAVFNWAKSRVDEGPQTLLEGPTERHLMAKELGRYTDLLKALGVHPNTIKELSCEGLWEMPFYCLANYTHSLVKHPRYFCHITARKDSGLSVTFFKQ
jgi:hypothetical protein